MNAYEHKLSKTPIPTTSETLLKAIGEDIGSRRWGEFVRKYRPMMKGYLKKNYPGLEADDIIQETLMALAKVLPKYVYEPEAKGPFHNYLTGILSNKAADSMRFRDRVGRNDEAYARARVDAGEVTMGTEEDAGEEATRVPVLAVPGEAPGTTVEEWKMAVVNIGLRELRCERKEDRQWQAFWRTELAGEDMSAVAKSLGMKRDAVYKTRERMKKRLAEIVKGLMDEV
jgi:RNA polymerase sigma factor (sigma-70 family)